MRRLCLLFCVLGVAGCHDGYQSQIVGDWSVDPDSVTTTRLAPGADKKADWTNAAKALGQVKVQFTASSVTATGLGGDSSGTWKLQGTIIKVDGGKEAWPDMVFDPRGPRIHTTMVRGADTVQMDLVRAK
ncbi:MAG TPA: hypothetical protein VHE55_03075 [Fimbriimonadaceae bacterium]|nr:hypothetical protein [Fimbriimonadaceae bacterium]